MTSKRHGLADGPGRPDDEGFPAIRLSCRLTLRKLPAITFVDAGSSVDPHHRCSTIAALASTPFRRAFPVARNVS
jgi:hypothetical protein